MMKASAVCAELVKRFEGCVLTPYLCPAGKLTIGYGHLITNPREAHPITQHQACVILDLDLHTAAEAVIKALGECAVTQGQFDALVSFVFNLGPAALERSRLLRYLKAGDTYGAADEFKRWVYVSGTKSRGLMRRREAERRLFLGLDERRA